MQKAERRENIGKKKTELQRKMLKSKKKDYEKRKLVVGSNFILWPVARSFPLSR